MLIAFVQGVISAFHEYFCPLNECGCEETGKGTNKDFLEEGGVHPLFNSNDSASSEGLYKIASPMRLRAQKLRIFRCHVEFSRAEIERV